MKTKCPEMLCVCGT